MQTTSRHRSADVAVGYAADRAGNGIAYAAIATGTDRAAVTIDRSAPQPLPALDGREFGYAAVARSAPTCAAAASAGCGCGSPTRPSSTSSTAAARSRSPLAMAYVKDALRRCMASRPPASNAANRLKPTISRPAPKPRSRCAPPRPPEPAIPSSSQRRLTAGDLPGDTIALSRALIGKLLVRERDGELLAGRIVETEAYFPTDPASHAFRGPTRRNRAMFGPPLHAYVYFIYGANWCLNVTSEGEGVGAAALVRACEPLAGLDAMRALRGRPGLKDRELARGPGNLCRAFAIGPEFDGADLAAGPRLWLADDGRRLPVGVSPRIGITKAAAEPLRFYARGNPSVSGRRALSP